MKQRHMSNREWRTYKKLYKDYAEDLEREHGAYFSR